MQSPDASTWALYEGLTAGPQWVERISYSSTGLATFLTPEPNNVNVPSGYVFTDLGSEDWHFLYHGGHLEQDQDLQIGSNSTVNDRQSGLLWMGGVEYDSTSGRQVRLPRLLTASC